MSRVAYVKEWIESERGWGCRPDGYYVYTSREAAAAGTKLLLDEMVKRNDEIYGKNVVPECYSRPCDGVDLVEVSDEAFKAIEAAAPRGHYVDKLKELDKLTPPPINFDI
jgi:hypothetical protein